MTIYKFAGFWRRLIAYLIDSTITAIVFFILFMIAVMAFFFGSISGNNSGLFADLMYPEMTSSYVFFIWIFYEAVSIAYFTYFHGTTGRTPGKMFLGLQVISTEGAPISFGIAFLRAVGYLVSGALFNLGFIWIAFDKKKQGWHDKIAATVVIIREPQNKTAGISIPDNYPSFSTPQNYMEQEDVPKESVIAASKPPENNND